MIGILGGSFDPVHTAHLAMADAFAGALMLALEGHEPPHGRYAVDARELVRGGATYTVDTLADLRRELGPCEPLVFLFGADQLVHLDTWRDWRRLWDDAHLAAVTRPGFDVAALPTEVADAWASRTADAAKLRSRPAGCSFFIKGLALDVSATEIRATLARRGDGPVEPSLARLVPPAVLDYIRANRLYRS